MKLLITGAAAPTDKHLQWLKDAGHEVWVMPDEHASLPTAAGEIEGVIGNGLFLHHNIADFHHLQYIQLTSAGLDRVPMGYAQAHGITVHNAAGVYSIPMAEFALSSVLQIYKQHAFFCKNQQAHLWEKHRGLRELCGQRVGIVGCGNVGTACAARFTAMGCTVIGVDLFPREDNAYAAMHPLASLHEVLSTSDIAILTLPLTPETRHLIGKDELACLPDEAILLNLARGAVVDTEALIAALQKRPLFAVLDVFEEEPLDAASPLWDMARVRITPHNSFIGNHNHERLWHVIQNNLENYTNKQER